MQSGTLRISRRIKLDTLGRKFPKLNEICNIIIISFFSSNHHRKNLMAVQELSVCTDSAQPPYIEPWALQKLKPFPADLWVNILKLRTAINTSTNELQWSYFSLEKKHTNFNIGVFLMWEWAKNASFFYLKVNCVLY